MKTQAEIRAAWLACLGSQTSAARQQRACLYEVMNFAASTPAERVSAQSCDPARLKALYRAASKALHPDRSQLDRRYFQQLGQVYTFLSDADHCRALSRNELNIVHPFAEDWSRYVRAHPRTSPATFRVHHRRPAAAARRREHPVAANPAELAAERQRLFIVLGLILGGFVLLNHALNACCRPRPRRQQARADRHWLSGTLVMALATACWLLSHCFSGGEAADPVPESSAAPTR